MALVTLTAITASGSFRRWERATLLFIAASLGPWVNPAWLNVAAAVIITALLMLFGTLMARTTFPYLDAARLAIWLSAALGAGLAIAGLVPRLRQPWPGTGSGAPGRREGPGNSASPGACRR